MEMAAASRGAAPKIARPRQVYTGETARLFLPAHKRGGGCACAGCVTRAGSGKLGDNKGMKGNGVPHHDHSHHHHAGQGHGPRPVPAVTAGR